MPTVHIWKPKLAALTGAGLGLVSYALDQLDLDLPRWFLLAVLFAGIVLLALGLFGMWVEHREKPSVTAAALSPPARQILATEFKVLRREAFEHNVGPDSGGSYGGLSWKTFHDCVDTMVNLGVLEYDSSRWVRLSSFGRRVLEHISEADAGPTALRQATSAGPALADQLREVRGADTLPYEAHIVFLDNAQRLKAERLRDAFELAGWQTNYTNLPQDRLPLAVIGVEVKAVNGDISGQVAEILNATGNGPAQVVPEKTSIKQTNPKWPLVQRTVRLLIGYPPE